MATDITPPSDTPAGALPAGDPPATPAEAPPVPLPESPPPGDAPPANPPAPEPEPDPEIELTETEQAAGLVLRDQHVEIPRAAFRSLVEAAEQRGRAAFEAQILTRLSGLPFTSIDDLLQAIAQQPPPETPTMADPVTPNTTPSTGTTPPGQPPPAASSPPPAAGPAATPSPITPPAASAPATPPATAPTSGPELDTRALPEATRKRVAQFREDMRNQVTAAERARATAEASAQQHQATIERMRAEETLKISLASTGITDFDFAWHQLQQHISQLAADKSPEGVERFGKFSNDPRAAVREWTEEQRKARPYLFGVQPVPASTGAPQPGAHAPAPPNPAAVAGAAGAGGQFDARQASPADFAQRMKQYGVNYNGRGQPFRG